jgi:hypothetical protein
LLNRCERKLRKCGVKIWNYLDVEGETRVGVHVRLYDA